MHIYTLISRRTCTERCSANGGNWNTTDFSCHVPGYLRTICIRVKRDNSTWRIDDPPSFPVTWLILSIFGLNTNHVNAGCWYDVAENLQSLATGQKWLSSIYTRSPSPTLTVQIRHAADPEVRVSAITKGCSSRSVDDARCFGSPKSQRYITVIICFVFGIPVLLCEIAVEEDDCLKLRCFFCTLKVDWHLIAGMGDRRRSLVLEHRWGDA